MIIQLGPAAAVDQVSISRVTGLQSDHCAIETTISKMYHQTKPEKRKFINKKDKWPIFRKIVQEANYILLEDFPEIDNKIKIFTKIMMGAAHKAVPKTSSNTWAPTGNKIIKNLWNELCSVTVKAKNMPKKTFQRHPSMSTAIEYKRSSEKVKKKHAYRAKERHGKNF